MAATLSLEDAIVKTLADHLDTALSNVRVIAGWPEYPETRDLGSTTVVSVAQVGQATRTQRGPAIERELPNAAGGPKAVVNAGHWSGVVQVTAWSGYKAALTELNLRIESALNPNALFYTGLNLIMATYHNGNMAVEGASMVRQPENEDNNSRGAWMTAWDLRVTADILHEVATYRQDVIHLVTSTDVRGALGTVLTETVVVEEDP